MEYILLVTPVSEEKRYINKLLNYSNLNQSMNNYFKMIGST